MPETAPFGNCAPVKVVPKVWLVYAGHRKVEVGGAAVSRTGFHAEGWYRATVPGTVLTTLVDNKVYPEPLYGENMRAIPESLNRTSYWYRTTFAVPANYRGGHTWLRFGGLN